METLGRLVMSKCSLIIYSLTPASVNSVSKGVPGTDAEDQPVFHLKPKPRWNADSPPGSQNFSKLPKKPHICMIRHGFG